MPERSLFVRVLWGLAYNTTMDEVAEIKNRLEVAEVVGNYLPLKQSGRNLKAPCPFHQEKSASFMVSPERGIFHCFGCNEGGDIFTFVMKMEGLEFREALEKLARQAGVELKARKGDNAELTRRRTRLYEAHALAVRYFQASLIQNPEALDYAVKQRHLGRETVRDFQIGYAPDSWNALTDFLGKKGFSYQELLEGGLAGQKEGRQTVYDLFRGRLTFTICDRDGRPIGFTARVLDDGLPKYLNTPQTPLYDKSSAIFGLHLARESIRAHDEVVLVEGNMDVVASHQAGVKQVVAASGTALTLDQLRSLSRLTKNVKLAFDSDRAGLAATERAIELGQKLGLTLRMVQVPDAKDADELIQRSPEAWREAIASAKYIVDYAFERFEGDYDLTTAIGKRQYADRLASTLRRLGDPVEQDHYVKLLASKLGIDEEAIRAKLKQPDKPSYGSGQGAVTEASEPSPRAKIQSQGKPDMSVQQEEAILAITLAHPLTRLTLQDLEPSCFTSNSRQAIYEAISRADRGTGGDAIARGLEDFRDYALGLLMVADKEYGDLPEDKLAFQAFETAAVVAKNHYLARQKEIIAQLREAELAKDEARIQSLSAEYQAVLNKGA